MKMQEETQAVYQKYGVSATGSCVQLAIQLPILYALYQVIQNIPAYVGSVLQCIQWCLHTDPCSRWICRYHQ